ncbi:hypothetical protein [Sulfobacillus harzensis]|uniref:Uncharacterized protein n=1 Tax=Sulfobacillus harzensis TaxID=2729629 RepID=A0A7Y0L8A5_9FIRM|nr:hypothetical protein [Sulfobacillus harzensis]NMP24626.1 hypothetical protein [Sulfobacillus harzensis]
MDDRPMALRSGDTATIAAVTSDELWNRLRDMFPAWGLPAHPREASLVIDHDAGFLRWAHLDITDDGVCVRPDSQRVLDAAKVAELWKWLEPDIQFPLHGMQFVRMDLQPHRVVHVEVRGLMLVRHTALAAVD